MKHWTHHLQPEYFWGGSFPTHTHYLVKPSMVKFKMGAVLSSAVRLTGIFQNVQLIMSHYK